MSDDVFVIIIVISVTHRIRKTTPYSSEPEGWFLYLFRLHFRRLDPSYNCITTDVGTHCNDITLYSSVGIYNIITYL